jgi:hypothetical protein
MVMLGIHYELSVDPLRKVCVLLNFPADDPNRSSVESLRSTMRPAYTKRQEKLDALSSLIDFVSKDANAVMSGRLFLPSEEEDMSFVQKNISDGQSFFELTAFACIYK